MKKLVLIIPALLFLSACAAVSVDRLHSDADYKGGIRFYRPVPYLLISNFSTGERQANVVWLPNKNEEYVVKVHSGMGTVDAKFTLQDGWNLTEFGEARDSKTAELIGSATGLLKAVEPLIVQKGEGIQPGLYAIEFDSTTGLVKALKRITLDVERSK